MSGSLFGQLIFDGLAIGLVFVILGCGLIIIVSISKILFLAYGAFYTIGAYGTWYAITYLHINYWFGLILGVAIAAAIGIAVLFPYIPTSQVEIGEQGLYVHLNRLHCLTDVA